MESLENRTLHDEGLPEAADLLFADRCCCCFVAPLNRRRTSVSTSNNSWERIHSSDCSSATGLWKWASMKLRDWSELVGGPRWKNFIRRFNKSSRHLRGSTRTGVMFHYDPLSYALNFDENPDPDVGFRDFSSRFAAPPLPAKSSVDLGGTDALLLVPADSIVLAATAASAVSTSDR